MPCFSSFRFFSCFLLIFLFAASFYANSAQPTPAPVLAAKSWILIDHATGQILAENDPDSRIEPASLTKLMTAYLTFKALKAGTITEGQEAQVSTAAWKQEGSRMFIEPRTPVAVGDLIRGVIVQSGNDACVALAELLGGSEGNFAAMMNREAARLGMKDTHFMNSNGLPHPQHYTTARDLATLASALVWDFPDYYGLYSIKSFTYNRIQQSNRNRLLFIDSTVDGMKTGQTKEAGFCLVASASRGSRRLVSVVLGASSDLARAQESLKLLNYGFQSHDMMQIYAADQALSQFRVWKGTEKMVSAGFTHDLIMSLPKGKPNKIEPVLESRQPVFAPLAKGQEIGTLTLTVDGELYGSFPVVALSDVPQAGFFGRTWDAIMLWFKSLL
ncbi:MAG: D-alanyl-D-alanine carboxypeptidase [Betaproteobacteria bacterium]|jgi:D-alanyl-D-alanine carboxypeptidase (penicillin-binding protein 5/6)|nr:D-alanyl-D-alanine carboxypeptidase [Betaproteobacteria bacterium]